MENRRSMLVSAQLVSGATRLANEIETIGAVVGPFFGS